MNLKPCPFCMSPDALNAKKVADKTFIESQKGE